MSVSGQCLEIINYELELMNNESRQYTSSVKSSSLQFYMFRSSTILMTTALIARCQKAFFPFFQAVFPFNSPFTFTNLLQYILQYKLYNKNWLH